jgi:hypothetical protein
MRASVRVTALLPVSFALTAVSISTATASGNHYVGHVNITVVYDINTDRVHKWADTEHQVYKARVNVKLVERPGKVIEEDGSSYTSSSERTDTWLDRDFFGNLTCTTTTAGTTDGKGKFKSSGGSGNASITPIALPDGGEFSARSTGLLLQFNIPTKGEETVTTVGAGNSPCQNGSRTRPVDSAALLPGMPQYTCFPGKAKPGRGGGSGIVGAWNKRHQQFDFECNKTSKYVSTDPEVNGTVTVNVSGTIKLK